MAVFVDVNTDFSLNTKDILLADVDAIKNKILNLFRCPLGSRLHRPTFGVLLGTFVHELSDNYTSDRILSDLIAAVKKWVPEVELDLGECTVDPLASGAGFSVSITYYIPKLMRRGNVSFSAVK